MKSKQLQILASWVRSVADELMRIDANRYDSTIDTLLCIAIFLGKEANNEH